MKPNTKSIFFKFSLACFVVFFVQLFIVRVYVQRVVNSNQSTSLVGPLYWLGLLWIGLGSTFYYKTTKYRQTPLKQLLVFVLSPIVFAPLIGVTYVIIVLLPLYGQVSQSGFTH